MTPAGERWVRDQTGEASYFDISEAEFWIRSFCAEVEQRGKSGDRPLAISASFEELKNELLGDSNDQSWREVGT